MQKVMIKPLSVNKAWKGSRYKTDDYKYFEKELLLKLKPMVMPNRPYKIYYEFGFSNVASDFDNPLKMVTDIMQKKFLFNDKDIYEANIKKVIVKKGEEYFAFKIESLFENGLKL